MDAQAKIRQTYLVEHYRPGFTVEALQQCATRIRVAADEMGREGKPVRYVRSTIVPADESLLCLLEAATEELVHETYARAGIPFDRISPAIPEAGEGHEQPPGAGGCATESN
jgi:Protein of unknown function (DUF4242)